MSPDPDGGRPIERGFPVERVNDLVERESRAKRHYRPVYTMHKWWARRPGTLLRAVLLYTLVDGDADPQKFEVREPGQGPDGGESPIAGEWTAPGGGERAPPDAESLVAAAAAVDREDPSPLWDFYHRDVRLGEASVLDPFAGGGTSLVEASRFDVRADGVDLNPVAWYVTRLELAAGEIDPDAIRDAFEDVAAAVAEDLRGQYRTPCPNAGDDADPNAPNGRAGHHEDACDGHHDAASDGHLADAMYVFWVKVVDCSGCGAAVSLFKDHRVASGRYGDEGEHVHCPACGGLFLATDPESPCTCECEVDGEHCGHTFVPAAGVVSRRGTYSCPECGHEGAITDAIDGRGDFDRRQYAIEYYCRHCEDAGRPRSAYKGFKPAGPVDRARAELAAEAWERRDGAYVPEGEVERGWYTAATEFAGSAPGAHDVFEHGYERWTDLHTPRQLYCLSRLLEAIDDVDDPEAREYLLLAFSDALMFNNTFCIYNRAATKVEGLFRLNAYVPGTEPVENNVWGTRAGRGTFANTVEKVLDGVAYAGAPTERVVDADGESHETAPFGTPVGGSATVHRGDVRDLDAEDAYDAVLTDPPYYDNVLYAELANFFHAWLRVLLADEHEAFRPASSPRADSIVANPAADRTVDDFERGMAEAFETVHAALTDDGVLAFTYHHSDADSWGELLGALCDAGFGVTATYPINSDLRKFIEDRAAAAFDVLIIARPDVERLPTSWNALRRRIAKAAWRTRDAVAENRPLSDGDVGVVEMGACFRAYSRHHGAIRGSRAGMTATDVVEAVYGIVQGCGRDATDVYLDLLDAVDPSPADLRRHLDRSAATLDDLRERTLVTVRGDSLAVHGWDDGARRVAARDAVRAGEATTLDVAQFRRARYADDRAAELRSGERATAHDGEEPTDLVELCEGLAEATGDPAYLDMLDVETTLADLAGE